MTITIYTNTGMKLHEVTGVESKREAVKELLSRNESLTGASLVGVDLSGMFLNGVDFSLSDLNGVDFSGSNLSRANFNGADLRGVNFEGANLAKASFAFAKLYYGALEKAAIETANLEGVDFSFAPTDISADIAETTATPSLSELESKIVLWAKEKGITKPDNAKNQFIKTVEEVGELASALAKNDLEEVKDSVGDIIVTLIILAEIKGFSATEALANVYDIISKRTGKTVGGVFIKDE